MYVSYAASYITSGRSNYRIGGHRTASEFYSLPHRTNSDYIGHSQYHIGHPK